MKHLSLFTGTLLFLGQLCTTCNVTDNNDHEMKEKYTNHLIHESSPYLLQHAHNPVDWYPWGEEALSKAKQENKLLLISVGYAACHWCHVMERESFEDTIVSRLMNDNFISIKVDREERPDIDDIYMNAAYFISGRGGWPLNAIALPDGRPVFAGTYFPRDQWMQVLEVYANAWKNEPQKVINQAEHITDGVKGMDLLPDLKNRQVFSASDLQLMKDSIAQRFDFEMGGHGAAPKFPMPSIYLFLLRHHYLTGDKQSLEMVETTLEKMAYGGIYDQLGGGFARYATDRNWKVPHFEKMLYDNGQLISLYSEAYRMTRNPLYRQVIEESLAFVDRELTSPEGGFYSSLDADSEGEEGMFYVWTEAEIDSLLRDARLFKEVYNLSSRGNWEKNRNILYRDKSWQNIAEKNKMSAQELHDIIERDKSTLLKARNKREKPGLDDKVLTGWNALMMKGYIDAYRSLGSKAYLETALRNALFLRKHAMQENGRLNRNYKNGKSSINAFLDDYASLADAWIDLYEVTFDEQWLHNAHTLTQYAIDHFSNDENGLFYFTSDQDPALIARKMELNDNVIPGSNSMMARVLIRLGLYLYKPDYLDRADKMMSNMKQNILKAPAYNSNWGIAAYYNVAEPFEVAIVGEEANLRRAEFDAFYLPDVLFLGGVDEGSLELLEGKNMPGETMIYVCRQKTCQFPVTTVAEALDQIKNAP